VHDLRQGNRLFSGNQHLEVTELLGSQRFGDGHKEQIDEVAAMTFWAGNE